MNPNHDEAQRRARRHERDLHWAKERRRQQEREAAEAAALLATPPLLLARRTLVVSVALLLVVSATAWWAHGVGLPPGWTLMTDAAAFAAAVGVVLGAAVALLRLRARRSAARDLLRRREERLAHTQFHIRESVHLFIDSRAEVASTRPA